MGKRLIILPWLLLSFLVRLAANPAVISRVQVTGNKAVSLQKILLLMKSRPGAEFSEENLREDIRRLAETGYFSDVSYQTQDQDGAKVITVTVRENPVLDRITFTGNRVFKTKDLKATLGLAEGAVWDEARLSRGLEEIRKKYEEKGVLFTEVTSSTIIKEDRVILNVQITEGRRAAVGEIVFEGNYAFPASRLRKLLKTKVRRMPLVRGTFKQEIFDQDLANLQRFYRQHGYLDSMVQPEPVVREKKRLVLKIKLNEGRRYFLGEISFKGNLVVPESALRDQLVLKKKGEVFNQEKAEANLAQIKRFYLDRGYVRVFVEPVPEKGAIPEVINLTYFVEPGQVFSVDEVIIKGNTKTKDKVIRREVKLAPGEEFSGRQLTRSYNNLRDLNYFEEINLYPEPMAEEAKANLMVEVKEKERTGVFMFGGGFSSIDKLIGFVSVEQTNFDITNWPSLTGGGQDVKLWLQMGSVSRNFSLSFTEPYFLDRPVWLGPDLYNLERDWDDYSEKRLGGDLRIGRRWDDFSLGFMMKSEKIDLSDITIPSLADQAGRWRKNSLTTSLDFHKVDSLRFPTKGSRTLATLEYAGGLFQGDLDFYKGTVEQNFYYPLGRCIFHSKTYAGMIEGFGDTETIPIYERFYGGGIGTVRGYKERSLGPKDPATGASLGGNALFAQNFELLYPIYQDIIKGVVFIDIGNVWQDWDNINSPKKGVGTGVRVAVPFLSAPIQIDYGIALDREAGESRGRLHLGMSFGF